jgi:DNA-binding MarR family transcriptional regulator
MAHRHASPDDPEEQGGEEEAGMSFQAGYTAGVSEETDAEAAEIVRALRRIIRRVSLHSKRLSKEAGLTLPQIVCLRALGDAGRTGLTVADISSRIQLSSPTVSGILDRLERAGLIARERQAADRRKVSVYLTDSGRNRISSLPPPLQEKFLERLAGLSADERRRLHESLQMIVELMEASELDASPILVPDEVVRKT